MRKIGQNVLKKLVYTLLISAILLTGCISPGVKKVGLDWGNATTSEAKEADRIGQEQINQYDAKYGPKTDYKIIVENNIDIPLRDGTVLKANIFRPDGKGNYPVIMSLTGYMKDRPWPVPPIHEAYLAYPQAKYQVWEMPVPEEWVLDNYTILIIFG